MVIRDESRREQTYQKSKVQDVDFMLQAEHFGFEGVNCQKYKCATCGHQNSSITLFFLTLILLVVKNDYDGGSCLFFSPVIFTPFKIIGIFRF